MADHLHVTYSDTDGCLSVDSQFGNAVRPKEDRLPWKCTRIPVRVTSFERPDPAQDGRIPPVDFAPLCGAYSIPRSPLPNTFPRQACEKLLSDHQEQAFETSTECHPDDAIVTPWRATLGRCWSALEEALDELGNVWDGHDDPNGLNESPKLRAAQTVNATKSSTKHNSEEPGTPRDRLRLQSIESRPSHYDTLTPSPVGSRSSKRGRKSRVRYKSPTPARNKHDYGYGYDIDHAYSTEDGNNDPHIRLENKVLFQKSFGHREDVSVFIHKQDSRKGSADPDAENNKPVPKQDQEGRVPGHEELPPVRRRAPIADALGPPDGGSGNSEPVNMAGELCRHGVPLVTQRTCERLHETNCDPGEPEQAQQPFYRHISQERSHAGASSSSHQHVNDRQLREANYGACEANTEEVRRIPTPDNLRNDLHEIFRREAQGQGPLSRKEKWWRKIVEATRPRHNEAWPANHVPRPPQPGYQRIDRPGDDSNASETRVPLLPKKKKPRRGPEGCIVSSASIPSERNTTDLLLLPFDTLHQDSTENSQTPTAVEASEFLMSSHGIRSDMMMADKNSLDLLCSADELMVRSAAMGSMSRLDHIDKNTRTRNATDSLARQDTASAMNKAWHQTTDAVSDRTMSPDFADSAASFQQGSRHTTIASEQRATVLYNIQNMYQGVVSADPIKLAIRKRLSHRELQGYLNHV